MNALEKYLTEAYPFDQQDVVEIEKALTSAARVYAADGNFDPIAAWPYEVSNPYVESKKRDLSQNTTAMIINSLLRFRGDFKSEISPSDVGLKKHVLDVPDARDKCKSEQLSAALALLLTDTSKNKGLATFSKTYGDDDVFTIAWLVEIAHATWEFECLPRRSLAKITPLWQKLPQELARIVRKKVSVWKAGKATGLFSAGINFQDHSFPVLRLVQSATKLKVIDDYNGFYKYFERSLHEQLSFSSIPDSRFDPAELIFCLEGMLLCQPTSVDRTIFDRVLEVLTLAQNQSAFWRPVKPFLASPQGMVLFPVSVEVANSLMRCCVMFDRDTLHDTYGSKCIPLMRRYWQWLRSRSVSGPGDPDLAYKGWHSEHVNQTATIHLWETSQVMEFLMSYRNTLHQHIARTTLVLSRIKMETFPKREKWPKLESKFEPVSSLGDSLKIYRNIGQDFIDKRNEGGNESFSMLLYGPPGTGKTTVAKSVAQALGYRMLTVTVSDFLASGGAQVEARAKDIFTVLMAQPACVVLFDEIDHFLLDRDSLRYSKQETLFQFMTPGMLTKIADLRGARRVLFIIATNYEDRIDPAIKRTGRIDRQYLLLPPDSAKRLAILSEMLSEAKFTNAAKFSAVSVAVRQRLADDSALLGHSDISAAVQIFLKSGHRSWSDLSRLLRDRPRTISVEGYQGRFLSDSGDPLAVRETPMSEFLAVAALKSQSEQPAVIKNKAALRNAAAVIKAASANPDAPLSAGSISDCDVLKLGPARIKTIFELFSE